MLNRNQFSDGETFFEPDIDIDAFVDSYNVEHSFIDELSVFDGL